MKEKKGHLSASERGDMLFRLARVRVETGCESGFLIWSFLGTLGTPLGRAGKFSNAAAMVGW